jgi:hypothetical protein
MQDTDKSLMKELEKDNHKYELTKIERTLVLTLFGDDYQLPSIIGNSGATNIPQINKNSGTKGMNEMTRCQEWLEFMNI